MIKLFTFYLLLLITTTLSAQNIKVFILAGQSNAQGHGDINPVSTQGTLSHFVANDSSNEFNYLQDVNNNWVTRSDVWVRYDHESNGLLTGDLQVGYGGWEGQIGPELGMGHLLGENFDDKVLIIKTCWGGKSLAVDFRPPSSEGAVGPYYTQMINDIQSSLNNIGTEFPEYNGETIELAGFVWFQGWNDGEFNSYIDEYESNLINLIADVRTDLNEPNLPVVVGLTGNGGYEINEADQWFKRLQTLLVPAQINATESEIHEYVAYAETRGFWKEVNESPANAGHHWHNNAESYLRIGNAFGLKMIELLAEINLGVGEVSTTEGSIVFPSPAYDYIKIVGVDEHIDISVFNITNNLVLLADSHDTSQKIDISMLPTGVYFLHAIGTQNNRVSYHKFIKK